MVLPGLEIGINIGQSDLLGAAGGVAGAIVLVHAPETTPFPEDYGVMLTPGVFNIISLRLLKLSRMPAPYGDCMLSDVKTANRDAYQEILNTTYTKVVSILAVLHIVTIALSCNLSNNKSPQRDYLSHNFNCSNIKTSLYI
jgi:hypothetical protein